MAAIFDLIVIKEKKNSVPVYNCFPFRFFVCWIYYI